MLNNITVPDLLKSKTFWGSLLFGVVSLAEQMFPGNAKVMLYAKVLTGLLTAIGIVDRTATPNTGNG